jgi:glutathione S-transferase
MPADRVAQLISTELHKSSSPLFNPSTPEDAKSMFRQRLLDRFEQVDEQQAGTAYTMGDGFRVAEAYLFVALGWASTSASTCRATRTCRPSWAAWPRARRCRKR